MRVGPVVFREVCENGKLGPMSATYVSQASCPDDCPLLGRGCYADVGHTWQTTRRVLEELRADFEAEGNTIIYETTMGETKRMDWGTGCRYLYLVSTERAIGEPGG